VSTECRMCVSDVTEMFRELGGAEVDIIHERDSDAKTRIDYAIMTANGAYCLSKETKAFINRRLSEMFKEVEGLREGLPKTKVPRVKKFLDALRDIQFVVARDVAEYCQSVCKKQEICSSSPEPKPASSESEAEEVLRELGISSFDEALEKVLRGELPPEKLKRFVTT